jgi:hypothetical protein
VPALLAAIDLAVYGIYLVNAYPSFLNVFGIRAKDGSLNIPPSWQNGIGAATNCGEVIGLQVSRPSLCWYSHAQSARSQVSFQSGLAIGGLSLWPL